MINLRARFWWNAAVSLVAASFLSPQAFAAGGDITVAKGRLEGSSSGAPGAAAGAALRVGASYAVTGLEEAQVTGGSGASFRALPGARFSVLGADAGRLAVRLDQGVLADATGGDGSLDVATPAVVVHGERARVFVRVLPRGVYAEHEQGSAGTVEIRARNAAPASLAAGTFRMVAFDAGDAPLPAGPVPAGPPAPVRAVTVAAPPAAPVPPRSATYIRPAYAGPAPCAPTPAPCAPCAPVPPPCGTCGEWVIASDIPVPTRADDTGRPPLGHALGEGECCGFCCTDTICNKIPYVHYVEGLVCDVSTYKVGCTLVTIRPASRVRVHRLPDGSLEIWAPNIGKDLALIEINENQFGYIGEDGFLVVGRCGTIEYFRGLVHLYTRRDWTVTDHDIPRRREHVSGATVTDEIPPRAEAGR